MIADANRQMLQLPTEGEPTKLDQNYGTIANSHAHRRERQGSGPKPTMATAQTTQTTQTAKPSIRDAVSKPMPSALTAEEPKESKATTTEAPAKKPVPSLKRGGSSGIMQAFAKGAAAAKPKKQQNSQQAAPIKAEESPVMTLSDDDEDDAEDIPQPKAAADQEVGRKSRKEREDQLRRMMDEEDSDDDDDDDDEKEDTPMEDAEEPEEPVEAPPAPAPKTEGPAEVVSASTGDGRRRGKRRVMRKKQVMDDQGYLGELALSFPCVCGVLLTVGNSDDAGTGLGVLLGRGESPVYEVEPGGLVPGFVTAGQAKEDRSKRPGQHYVILRQEVKPLRPGCLVGVCCLRKRRKGGWHRDC